MENNVIEVSYISIWNGGFEVETKALFNTDTGEVFDIQSSDIEIDDDGDELEFFEGEKIVLPDGKTLSVSTDDDGNCFVDMKGR